MSLVQTAQGLQPRVLALALGSIVAITAIAGVLYGIKAPYKAYTDLTNKHELLLPMVVDTGAIDNERINLEQQMKELRAAASRGAGDATSASQLIQTLDSLAMRHRIKLSAVTPLPTQDLGQVQEISYEVAASGPYDAFHGWVAAVAQELRTAVVRQFVMESGASSREVATRLTLSVYKSGGANG